MSEANSPIALSEAARDRIRRALASADPPRRHLRIEVVEYDRRWDYRMLGLADDEIAPEDVVFELGGFSLVLDPRSAQRLEGATLHYRESLVESGFVFDNPAAPESPILPSGARDDLVGPVPERVRLLLDSEINPAIAAHGGRVEMVEYRDGKVLLAFGGGCHGCGLVDVTLKQGIERRIREVVPEVVEVVDTTDHATGANPYL